MSEIICNAIMAKTLWRGWSEVYPWSQVGDPIEAHVCTADGQTLIITKPNGERAYVSLNYVIFQKG